ncbi:hypothetical protein IV203_033345 [Nitzschia inconspicua]|uniref:Uncharacterized protein n=1 Tax=Nitzschia inconspicua TaxID=303405 RepID=A0A9K3KLB1_9STRA|nr:hypothetical protein IV203_033345 [Nitzschia inconspicua]
MSHPAAKQEAAGQPMRPGVAENATDGEGYPKTIGVEQAEVGGGGGGGEEEDENSTLPTNHSSFYAVKKMTDL